MNMTRIFKFSIILFIVIICANTFSFASGINMDLSNNAASNTTSNTTGNTTQNTNSARNTATNNQSPITPNSSSALSSSTLEVSTIINILLIVVGILLILFCVSSI